MAPTNVLPWKSLEQRSGTAFLIAAGLLLVFAVLSGLKAFGNVTVSPRGNAAIGVLGLLAPLAGFIGLYPRVHESGPRLSLVGIGAVTLSAVGSLSLLSWTVVSFAGGTFSGDPPAWTAVALLVALVGNTVGFLLFGLIYLRTTSLSRTTGVLLLVPPLMWVVLFVGSAMTDIGQALDSAIYVVISAALMALSYRLRTVNRSIDHKESTAA